jgi:hypothetical protein
MGLAFTRKSRRRGGAGSMAHQEAELLDLLSSEFMKVSGIPATETGSYDTFNDAYKSYRAKYKRDPLNDARRFANNVISKAHKKGYSANDILHDNSIDLVNIKHNAYKKALEPNPIKRLFRRNRRTRRNRR